MATKEQTEELREWMMHKANEVWVHLEKCDCRRCLAHRSRVAADAEREMLGSDAAHFDGEIGNK